jgi:hypothetical protein
MRRVVAFTAFAALAVVTWGTPSPAAAPRQQGWWWSGNGGGAVATPTPPDVPADGLLVEGGVGSTGGETNSSPTSLAALVYDVGGGTTVTLKLAVAPSAATVPNVTLQLCPLAKPAIEPVQGGAMSAAPAFDCARNVTAQPSSDGATYEFEVSSLVGDGVLGVVVLPTTPSDRVVLAAPGADSLTVETAATSGSTDSSSDVASDPASGTPLEPVGGTGPGGSAVAVPPDDVAISSSLARASEAPAAGPATDQGQGSEGAVAPAASPSQTTGADEGQADRRSLLLVLAGGAILLGGWLAVGRNAALRAAVHQ